MIRPRGVVSETVSNSSLDTSLANIRLLGLYWDAPILIECRIQSHLRGASHHASLEYLACEARRQRLMFEARLRIPCYNIIGQTGVNH